MTENLANQEERRSGWRLHAALAVLGTTGIALNFFPFAADYVPINDAIPGGFLTPEWWSVLPAMLLPLPIAAGYGVWLTRGRLPGWYEKGALLLTALAVASSVATAIDEFYLEDIWAIAYSVAVLGAYAAVAIYVIRGRDRSQGVKALVAVQAAYFIHMTFWLAIASEEPQIGAWLGTVASLACFAQILLITRRAWPLMLLLPLAVMALAINIYP